MKAVIKIFKKKSTYERLKYIIYHGETSRRSQEPRFELGYPGYQLLCISALRARQQNKRGPRVSETDRDARTQHSLFGLETYDRINLYTGVAGKVTVRFKRQRK
ncbi:unnamed protein product [Arctia plantaginis]|uniref:Uncharacterized protein n=1 Tax=Arctia plantaginis TaxID=874455 RepID=A0A8S1AEI9_ARCPL|nr:unnamed protein product [Arctia plantaginis]CAB3243262.1 unnamed protein product [Arctia plantaginis]